MARALLISEIFPPRHGGSGRWFVELYGRLPKSGYLVAAGESEGDRATDAALSERLSICRLPLSSPAWGVLSLQGFRFYLAGFRRLSRLIRKENIGAVHCGRCLPEGVFGWLLNLRYRLPFLCFVHGEDIQTAAESRELSWLIRRVFARATLLIANSENTASLLREHWLVPGDRVRVLHPGMDAKRFVPAERDPAFEERMGWSGRRVILTVGRLQRRKGQDMLIRALPALLERHPDLLYAIIGDGEERAALEALAEELGLSDRVQFLGEVDDDAMIRCYQHCRIFALPNRTEGSDIEGFGMVLAEAQACGRPVLAGDSGGTREAMVPGETGVIADCTAPEPLSAALLQLLDHGDEELDATGRRGRAFARDTLDWGVHVEKAEALFAALDRSAPGLEGRP